MGSESEEEATLSPLPHPSHRLGRAERCPRCRVAAADESIRERCAAVASLKPITADSTPEEWAEAHSIVADHTVSVSAWGAVCDGCCALWSRDREKGGEARRNPWLPAHRRKG